MAFPFFAVESARFHPPFFSTSRFHSYDYNLNSGGNPAGLTTLPAFVGPSFLQIFQETKLQVLVWSSPWIGAKKAVFNTNRYSLPMSIAIFAPF